MVKKTTFLNRLVSRFRSGSRVRVEPEAERRTRTTTTTRTPAGRPAANRVKPEAVPAKAAPVGKSSRKISSQENAVIAMNESFGELASLLRGVQVRLENQGTDIAQLPTQSEAQLDVLKALAANIEKQNKMNEVMVQSFGELPNTVIELKAALEKINATEQRTVNTLTDFRQTMDRIQSSMGQMVQDSKTQADATSVLARDQKASAEKLVDKLSSERKEMLSDFEQSQESSAKRLEQTNQEGLKALRWAQEDQANRMIQLVGETGKWNRGVLVMLILVLAALASIFVALVSQ